MMTWVFIIQGVMAIGLAALAIASFFVTTANL